MNGLLGAALRGLGYDVLDGGARVAASDDDMEASDVFHISGHDHHILVSGCCCRAGTLAMSMPLIRRNIEERTKSL